MLSFRSPGFTDHLPPRHISTTNNEEVHDRVVGSLSDFAGTYTNPGYGNITLCSPEDTTLSRTCSSVIRDFAIVDTAAGKAYEPSLFSHWPRVWNSHLRVVPKPNTQDKFVVKPSTLFVEGYGKDKSPWEYTRDEVPMRFIRDESEVIGFEICGLVGRSDIIGDACEKFEVGEEVKKGLLVRFEKVNV